jgi:hypothetical protein
MAGAVYKFLSLNGWRRLKVYKFEWLHRLKVYKFGWLRRL